MTYLLDTNAVVALLAGNGPLIARVRRAAIGNICISALVLHELYFGAYKSSHTVQNLERIDQLRFAWLEFSPDDTKRSADIRAALQRQGTPIGPIDTLIAGQALARDLTLVTRNTREFARVDGLVVENWQD